MDVYSNIQKKLGPKRSVLMDSYLKMGITPQNAEGFQSQLASADKRRLAAMDPNSKLSKEEKEIALNEPHWMISAAKYGTMRNRGMR